MRSLLFLTLFLVSTPSFAAGFIPYEIDATEIAHCESGIDLNGKEPSIGFFSWSKSESGVDSFIVALNADGKTLYRFGNQKGQSFETKEERAFALENLIEKGICPKNSEL